MPVVVLAVSDADYPEHIAERGNLRQLLVPSTQFKLAEGDSGRSGREPNLALAVTEKRGAQVHIGRSRPRGQLAVLRHLFINTFDKRCVRKGLQHLLGVSVCVSFATISLYISHTLNIANVGGIVKTKMPRNRHIELDRDRDHRPQAV